MFLVIMNYYGTIFCLLTVEKATNFIANTYGWPIVVQIILWLLAKFVLRKPKQIKTD